MSAAEIIADMDILRHMLGIGEHIPKRDWCYRNYFNAEEGHSDMPSLLRLKANGLIIRSACNPDYWHATESGCKAIGLTAKQINKAFSK